MESRLLTETELKLLRRSTQIRIHYTGSIGGGNATVTFVKKIQPSNGWGTTEQKSEAQLPINITDWYRHKEDYRRPERCKVFATCDDHRIELLQAFLRKDDLVSVSAWMNNSSPANESVGWVADELFFCVNRKGTILLVPIEQKICHPSIRLIIPL